MDNKSNSKNEINYYILKSRKILLNSISSINHLLSLNRFQNNKSKVSYKDIDLYEIISNLIDEFHIVLEEKKQTIDNQISENTILTTDENIMKEILRNLIMNAIKFSYEGKSISLRYEESEYLHLIYVIDTGVGFGDFQSKTLDDSNFKIKSRMGTNGEIGYGLGLNLCKELIQLLDGSIQIQSNQGSSVILSIPINTNVLLVFSSNMELMKVKSEFHKLAILPIFSSSLSKFTSLTNDIFYKMIIIDLDAQPNLSDEFFEKIFFDFGKSSKPIVLLDLENKYQEDIYSIQNKFDSLKFVVWKAPGFKTEDIAFYCNELLLNL
jgi:two-component sensor histidine kinase